MLAALATRVANSTFAVHTSRRFLSVTLYQYEICPFCHKAKALLDYSKVDYEKVEVNPLTKSEIQWSKDYKKVPIAKLGNESVFGSDDIIDALLKDPSVKSSLEKGWQGVNMNLDTFRSENAKKWMNVANDLASLIYPNICRTIGDSYEAFGYVNYVSAYSAWDRLTIRGFGSLAMYMAASRIKSKWLS